MNIVSKCLLLCSFGLAMGLCPTKGRAEGVTIGVHTISAHVPQHDQTNTNWGIYARRGQTEAGIYRNSFARTGAYLAQGFELAQGGWGVLGLQVGVAYGYQRKCQRTYVTIPGEHHTERHEDGSSTSSTAPTTTRWDEHCDGFSKGAITPLAGFTYLSPLAIMGVTPRLQFMPATKGHSSVVHLTLEKML